MLRSSGRTDIFQVKSYYCYREVPSNAHLSIFLSSFKVVSFFTEMNLYFYKVNSNAKCDKQGHPTSESLFVRIVCNHLSHSAVKYHKEISYYCIRKVKYHFWVQESPSYDFYDFWQAIKLTNSSKALFFFLLMPNASVSFFRATDQENISQSRFVKNRNRRDTLEDSRL